MSSLYRKWRSRSFEDLVGQEPIVRTLRNAVQTGRVAHAYLFTGPRGTGKTSAARILAKALNCLHPDDGNPCNVCEMCVAANEARAMDVIEIDAASNTSVDNVRDLRERVAYAAGEGRFKVYIVDEVHRLSGAAFDAFLKTLEEPPPHVVFVFASTEPHKVPATIMSRCQRFDFRRIPPTVMADRVRVVIAGESLHVEDDALALIVLNAKGSLRDALGLLDQVSSFSPGTISAQEVRSALGLADPLLVARMSQGIIDGAVGDGLAELQQFMDAGGDAGQLGAQLLEYWRSILMKCVGASSVAFSIDPALDDVLARHAQSVTKEQTVSILRALAANDFGTKFDIPSELPLQLAYLQAALVMTEHSAPVTAVSIASNVSEPVQKTARLPDAASPLSAVPLPPLPAANGRVEDAPHEDAAESVAEQPATSSADGGGLQGVYESIVASMRAKSPSLQAILRSGYPMRIGNGEFVVGFLYEFHVNVFADAKKRKLLEEVVAEVMGVPYRVICTRSTKEEVESISGALPEDDGFIEEASERLRQYHARQLGNGNS